MNQHRSSKKIDKRKIGGVFALLLLIATILDPTLWYRIVSIFDYPLHYKEYRHFGIRIPNGFDIHGIDVSKWQRRIDWNRVKNMKVDEVNVHFAFIKATEGTWMKDNEFEFNWENAKKAGITRGAYHFFYPDVSPKMQALNFMKTVSLKSGDLPPVVDVEEARGMTRGQIQRYTKEFLRILESRYKVKPILYTNLDFYKTNFLDEPDFEGYRLWIAHYRVTDLDVPGEKEWHFWQHSDEGNITGIAEKVDFNVFYGDSNQFRKLCIP